MKKSSERNRHRQSRKTVRPSLISFIFPLLLILIFVACIFGVYRIITGLEPSAIPEIKSGIAGYCLDDYHNNAKQGNAVISAKCNGRPSQDWVENGTEVVYKHSYCLSVEKNMSTAGSGIVTLTCDQGSGQVWVSAIGGLENPSSGLCLDIPAGQTGAQLLLAKCNELTGPNETWAVSKWSKNNVAGATVSCSSGSEGQQVACFAAKEWSAWQSGSPSHAALLNEYSDGNGYEEWCADFVSYVYKEAGYPFNGGERDGWDEYLASGIQYENFTLHTATSGYIPQAGDVAYFDYPGGHVEIVAIGGVKPVFIYGDSGTTDPATGNGEMAENSIVNDPPLGGLVYYLTPG